MTRKRALAIAFVVAGFSTITASEVYLKSSRQTPPFQNGVLVHDKAGHNPLELFVDGVGVALIFAGVFMIL